MNRWAALAAVVLIAGSAAASETPVFHDFAFQKYRWGEEIKDTNEFDITYHRMTTETTCTMKKPGKFLGVQTTKFEYLLNDKKQLDSVRIELKGKDGDAMRDALFKILGKKHTVGPSQLENYHWDHSKLKVRLGYRTTVSKGRNDGILTAILTFQHKDHYRPRMYQTIMPRK